LCAIAIFLKQPVLLLIVRVDIFTNQRQVAYANFLKQQDMLNIVRAGEHHRQQYRKILI
jgi:hypothetical protein